MLAAVLVAGGGTAYAYTSRAPQPPPAGTPLTEIAPPVPVASPESVSMSSAASVASRAVPAPSLSPARTDSAAPTGSAALTGSPTGSSAPTGRPNPRGVNLALAGVATASAVEGDPWQAANAIDGDRTTRWSSGFSDPQWIRVDLKERWQLSEVTLDWETAYGVAYRVDVSLDGRAWTTIWSTKAGKGGSVTVNAADHIARYVRMYGTKRNSSYGFSLLEFAVR